MPNNNTQKDVSANQAKNLLNQAVLHGRRIKKDRSSNTKIDFLILSGGQEQVWADFLNDQHVPSLKENIGLEVKFITLNSLTAFTPKRLKCLMDLELILPLSLNGDVLDTEEVTDKFSGLKN